MKDDSKTKKQLVQELAELRSQDAALKKSTSGIISAELGAEESHRYAESIVETIREPLLVLDADLKIISANRNFYSTFKVIPGETLGCFIYDLGNKQWDIPKLRELLEDVLPEKQAFDSFEVDHNFQDIGHKIMLLNACRIYRKDIGATMILLAIEDITERKLLEELLTESEERYRRLFETAGDGIVLLEKREGKITHANPASEKMLGYTKQEIVGNKLQDIGVLLDRGDFQTTMLNLNKIGIVNYNDVPVNTKSGQRIDTDIYLVDRARLVQCNIRDITDRKLAEEKLRESEEKYRWVLNNMADVITVMDMNLHFTYVSPSIMRMRGYTAEEATAQTLEQVMTPESLQNSARVFEEEMKLEASGTADPGRSRILEVAQYRKDGSIVWMENNLSFMRDEAQKPVGIISLTRDITERKRMEDALRESEEKYRLSFQNVADVIYFIDTNLNILSVSPSVEKILGYKPQYFIGRSASDLAMIFTPESFEQAIANISLTLNGETIVAAIYQFIAKDGTIKYGEVSSSPVMRDGKIIGITAVARDITDRKRAEEELWKSEEEFRSLAESMPQIVWVTRKDGWNIYFNQQWVDYTGLTLEESYGHGWNIPFHPDDQQRAWSAWENATKNRGIYSLECRLRRADGVYHWWLVRGVPLLDETGEIIKWFGTCTDIDGIKNAEKQLQDTLDSLRRAMNTTIQVMVSAVEARDPYTSGHQIRCADLARAIAAEMGLDQEKIEHGGGLGS